MKAAGLALQILAPKCAICWTSYASLIGASWFAATQYNPAWFAAMALVTLAALMLTMRQMWRTHRRASACVAMLGWISMSAGWFVGMVPVRCAGFLMLAVATVITEWQRMAAEKKNRGVKGD